jgi:hypothetical protein
MAVRQLAGPFTLSDVNGGAVTQSNVQGAPVFWVPSLGLLVLVGGEIKFVSMSGQVCPGSTTFAAEESGYWWSVVQQSSQLRINGVGGSFLREGVALSPYLSNDPHTATPDQKACSTAVDLENARYTVDGTGHVFMAYPGTGWLPDSPSGVGLSSSPQVGLGRTQSEISIVGPISSDDYGLVFYDSIKHGVVSGVLHLGIVAIAAVYSPDLGVVLSLHAGSGSTVVLNVWSTDVVPSTVGEPVLYSGYSAQGQVGVYQVSILGAQGEPCVGAIVNWSTTGSGVLQVVQSIADQNGLAQTSVLHLISDTTPLVLTASVVC